MSDYPQHPDRQDEQFDTSVSYVWIEERISCPNRDLLRSYLCESLQGDHREYVQFHLETIGCPYCQANLEDLRMELQADQEELKSRLEQAREDTLASSGTLLDDMRNASGSA